MAAKRPWHRPQLRRVWMTIRARQVEPTVLTIRGLPVPVLPLGALPDPRDKSEGMALVPPNPFLDL